MFSHFVSGTRGIVRRWKDLHPGAVPSPRTGHTEAAEAIVTPDLQRPIEKRFLNLLAHPLPFSSVECRPWLYGDDLLLAEGECDAAIRTGERKVQFVRIAHCAIILTETTGVLIEKNRSSHGSRFAQVSGRRFKGARPISGIAACSILPIGEGSKRLR